MWDEGVQGVPQEIINLNLNLTPKFYYIEYLTYGPIISVLLVFEVRIILKALHELKIPVEHLLLRLQLHPVMVLLHQLLMLCSGWREDRPLSEGRGLLAAERVLVLEDKHLGKVVQRTG